jgi:C-terminal processing protease CtpA/Prc
MWDAILASVPEQKAPLLTATPPTVSGATLASYVGRYDFAAPKSIGDMRFGTIGITNMAVADGGAKVLKTMDGGPAARAGVVTGDVITHVDGDSLAGLSLDQMTLRMRGPVGSSVRLQLQRKDQPVEAVREASRAILDVRMEGPKLVIEAVGRRNLFEFEVGKPIAVVPLSDSTFYVDGRYRTQITFTKDGAGRASGAVLNPGPWEQKGVRVE